MNLCVFSIICDDAKFIFTIFLILGIKFCKGKQTRKILQILYILSSSFKKGEQI